MRVHYWQCIIDEYGEPIPNAEVSIYLAGTESPAMIYLDEVGGTVVESVPHLKTDVEGFFEFWIADASEPGGYSSTQKFKLAWERIGVRASYIDYIDIFPPTLEVNEFDTDPIKDKCLSNLLAYRWEQHRNNKSHIVHGIEEVDETKTDTKKNKLISNALANKWEELANFNFDDPSLSGDDPTLPLGLKLVDVTKADGTPNKLINNKYGNKWDSHVNFNFSTYTPEATGYDDVERAHDLSMVDPAKMDSVFNKLVSNRLLYNIYQVLNSTVSYKTYEISEGDWSFDAVTGTYYCNLFHGFDVIAPEVICYRHKTLDRMNRYFPEEIEVINVDIIKITMPKPVSSMISVLSTSRIGE